jgi:hypothetical protein
MENSLSARIATLLSTPTILSHIYQVLRADPNEIQRLLRVEGVRHTSGAARVGCLAEKKDRRHPRKRPR